MATIARTALAVLVVLLAVVHDAGAKAGDVDRRYGNRGQASTRLLDGAFAGLLQRDGRLLVSGGAFDPGLMRLTRSGRRDPTFGTRGVAQATSGYGEVSGLRRVGDELRIAVASTTTGRPSAEILRFTPRGDVLAPAVHDDYLPGPLGTALLRADGGAYVSSQVGIRAIAPDGDTDTAFAGGTLAYDGLPGYRSLRPVLASGDGFLAHVTRRGRHQLVRVTREGELDPSFGADGAAAIPFAPRLVRLARDGGIVGVASRRGFAAQVFRLRADAKRVRSFGAGGVAGTWRAKRHGSVQDVVEDARRRLYLLTSRGGKRTRVLALTRAGRPLRRFGRGGVASLPRPRRQRFFVPEDLVLDRRRGLLVVGTQHRGYYASHPVRDACDVDIRDDFCSFEQLAAVWRLRR